MTSSKKRSECPVSCTLDVFGDKWSLLIIRDLMFFQSRTYGDFQKSKEKIATNILASKLKSLEENGIITKAAHPDSKAKVLYKLTQKGIDLLPILVEINLWGEKYFEISPELKSLLNEIKEDKQAFIKAKTEELQVDSGHES
ncbi:MAG TPA: helix-turn-helix domain-containing protein [Algoriphagus sp.]|nr:helix-turn-helix domain-containing protein [Algoriphagus sp.]